MKDLRLPQKAMNLGVGLLAVGSATGLLALVIYAFSVLEILYGLLFVMMLFISYATGKLIRKDV